MADARTIAPSTARLRRAWQAGMRAGARGLVPAVACGLIAIALGGGANDVASWLRPGSVGPDAWLDAVAHWLVVGWLVALAVVLGVAALLGRLGSVSTRARDRLRPAPSRPAWLARAAVGLALAAGLALALRGVLATAARSVDASEAGLSAAWLGWATTLASIGAAALGLAALAELVIDRHERRGRLFIDRQRARDEARDRGGRAR